MCHGTKTAVIILGNSNWETSQLNALRREKTGRRPEAAVHGRICLTSMRYRVLYFGSQQDIALSGARHAHFEVISHDVTPILCLEVNWWKERSKFGFRLD